MNNQDLLNNHVEYIREQIELRIESIKYELDKFLNNYLCELDKLKKSLELKLNKFQSNVKSDIEKYENFLIEKQLNNDNGNKSNEIVKLLYKSEDYSLEIANYEHELNRLLRSIRFNSTPTSEIIKQNELVGQLINNLNINIDLRKIELNEVNLFYNINDTIKFPYYFCEINENFLVFIDIQENEIIVCDKHFKIQKKFNKIGGDQDTNVRHYFDVNDHGIYFDIPLALCTDDTGEAIYICDSGNDRVIVTSKEFLYIKHVIGKKGNLDGEFNHPRDICYSNKQLFVLDYFNQCVQIFDTTEEYDFLRKIRLYNLKQAPNPNILSHQVNAEVEDYDIIYDPYHMAVHDSYVAIIDYRTKVYIYNHHTCMLEFIIEQRYINTICFIDSYLFTHGIDGVIACYESNNFMLLFKRKSELIEKESYFLSYCNYNNKLIIGFKNLFAFI